MKAKSFTLEAVEWDPWLAPVATETATPKQRAVRRARARC